MLLFHCRMIDIQVRELNFSDFRENMFKVGLHMDAHKLISFKLGMMIEATKLYIFIAVQINNLDCHSRSQGCEKANPIIVL